MPSRLQEKHCSHGLTLIELVLALTLAAMLMSAIIGVLRVVTLQTRQANLQSSQLWPTRFINLLYRDLLTADSVAAHGGTFWIEGVLPAYAGTASLRSRSVGYACMTTESGHSALVRIDDGQYELIAIGPQQMIIERLDNDGLPQPLPPHAGPVPSRIRIWVWNDITGDTVLVRDLVL